MAIFLYFKMKLYDLYEMSPDNMLQVHIKYIGEISGNVFAAVLAVENVNPQPVHFTETTEVKETGGSRATGSQNMLHFCSKSLACSDQESCKQPKAKNNRGVKHQLILIQFGSKKICFIM